MKDEEKLMTASSVGGYIPKKCCTWNRYGEPDDESSCPEMCEYHKQDCMNCPIQTAFDRLGDYEQTGLSPDEIYELIEKERGAGNEQNN